MATATNKETKECLEAFDAIQEYSRKHKEEINEIVQGLRDVLKQKPKDPKGPANILLTTVSLSQMFSYPKISAKIAQALLVVFRHVWKTFSDFYSVPEHATLSSNINMKASGFFRKLEDSLRCLNSLEGNRSDSKQISTACSEVPLSNTGSEFFGELQFEILQLKNQEDEETCEETEARYKAIVDHLDLYCNLATLREFVFLYIVTLCIANENSQNTAEGYFGIIEGQRKDRESTLKILFEPEAAFAGVAAVFLNGDWPMLKLHTKKSLSSQLDFFNYLAGKKVRIVSSENHTFSMFRHPSENSPLLTRKKYIRVCKDKHTEFNMQHKLNKTHFVICPDAERQLTLKIDGSANGNLVTTKRMPDKNGQFNLVTVANGNVMLSCMTYPTCFVTMTNAKNDACLEAKNNGAGLNSQWHIMPELGRLKRVNAMKK